MTDTKTCDYCTRTDGLVGINDKTVCIQHIDGAMAEVFAPMKTLLFSGKPARPRLFCAGCNKEPKDFFAYVANGEDMSPEDFVWREEGTLDRATGAFLCDGCYIKFGMPSSPRGWTATFDNLAGIGARVIFGESLEDEDERESFDVELSDGTEFHVEWLARRGSHAGEPIVDEASDWAERADNYRKDRKENP